MNDLDKLSGSDFEMLMTLLLERMGFRTEMTGASGDGGIDIVATLDQPLTGGRFLVQCKRFAAESPVGAAVVREFYGAVTADRRAAKGILITTSGFTAQAQEFAAGVSIELIGREQLLLLLDKHGLHRDDLGMSSGLGDPNEPSTVSPEQRASALLDMAKKLMEYNRHSEAIKPLREVTTLRPDAAVAWLDLGICYFFVKLYDEQIKALQEAVQLMPNLEAAWSWLGTGLYVQGSLEAAEGALKRALEIGPENLTTLLTLASVYSAKDDYEAAISTAEKALKLNLDSVDAWRQLGVSLLGCKRNAEAASALREGLRRDPNHIASWYMLCHAYFALGESTRMLQALSRLEELNPAKAHELRSLVLRR